MFDDDGDFLCLNHGPMELSVGICRAKTFETDNWNDIQVSSTKLLLSSSIQNSRRIVQNFLSNCISQLYALTDR